MSLRPDRSPAAPTATREAVSGRALDNERDRESTDSTRPVPEQLLDVVAELAHEFATFTTAVTAQRAEVFASRRGGAQP